ncbi:MAG: TraR/DksA C4-type zinc finger protein [bacterium]
MAKIIAKLEEMREESQNIVNAHMQSDLMPREESLDVGDDLDQASNERDREFNLIMHQRHLRRLHQIEEAYDRMDDGSYGLCEGTDEAINPKRLLIMPLTKYSIEYQEMQEKTLGRISLDGTFPEMDESFGTDE